jgi:hypothetical protein
MGEELRFHIPLVGTVTTTLHSESAELYRWLRDVGEIERLKKLDHLGAIRLVWEGAHHPRWEYITLTWALIDRCAKSPEVHVQSAVALPTGETISSGQELLKCWPLLLNVGHLQWTFAAERALLFELWNSQEARQNFLKRFSWDRRIHDWAERILKEGRVYQLFQALAFIRLRRLASNELPQVPWQSILSAYVLDLDTSGVRSVQRLRRIYRELRRAAYLALDTHYTPSVMAVDPRKLLTDEVSLGRLALGQLLAAEDELAPVERYLYRDVYLAEPVIRAIAARESGLRSRIRKRLRANGLDDAIEKLASGELQRDAAPLSLQTVVRLPMWVSPPFDDLLLRAVNPRTRQARFERNIGECRRSVCASVWNVPFGNRWILQVHAPISDRAAQVKAYRVAFETVLDLKKDARRLEKWLNEEDLHTYLFEVLASSLVVAALELLRRGTEPRRWEWARPFRGPVALFATRRSARLFIERLLRQEGGESGERAELEAKRELLNLKPA